jgi:hypothetical protein
MKIWKAELNLFYNFDEELQTKFRFELQDKEYETNTKNNEWTYWENWTSERIPMEMTIEKYYDNYKITQGFDHELNKEELKQLEIKMRELMKKQLNYDKEMYLKSYEKKLKAVECK